MFRELGPTNPNDPFLHLLKIREELPLTLRQIFFYLLSLAISLYMQLSILTMTNILADLENKAATWANGSPWACPGFTSFSTFTSFHTSIFILGTKDPLFQFFGKPSYLWCKVLQDWDHTLRPKFILSCSNPWTWRVLLKACEVTAP